MERKIPTWEEKIFGSTEHGQGSFHIRGPHFEKSDKRSIIDRLIIPLINLKAITKEDFTETERGFYLKKEAVKSFLNQYEAEMERKNTKNTLSLKESIYVQTAIFKNYFLENKPLTFYAWNV